MQPRWGNIILSLLLVITLVLVLASPELIDDLRWRWHLFHSGYGSEPSPSTLIVAAFALVGLITVIRALFKKGSRP